MMNIDPMNVNPMNTDDFPTTAVFRKRRSQRRQPRLISLWLRGLAFLLTLCCLWSFAGAGIAQAAHERGPVPPKSHGVWMSPAQMKQMRAQALNVKARQAHGAKPGFPYRQAAEAAAQEAKAHPRVAVPRVASVTLLDQVGLLARPVPVAQVAAWYTEKNTGHPTQARAALLSLWMGEWELAHNQHPQVALPLFRQARLLSHPTDAVYGIAAYDAAMALFYEGAYADATAAFSHLRHRKSGLRGYDYNTCTLWLRHANACAAYHAVRADLGIPEPPRLDPLCGVAALAACLRSLGMPSSKQALLNASHITGEGNNLSDIADAARKLGASAYPVSAEDKTVIALPKPLVAYVEHDHFVALVRADKAGISYLCSDCGPWPGGRVNLTWAQWRQMNPGLYLAVTKPGSAWDQRLMASQPDKMATPVQVAMADPTGQLLSRLNLHLGGLALPKGVTVLSNKKGHWVYCGGRYYSPICLSYQCCHIQGGGPGGSGGPGHGGPGHGGLGGGDLGGSLGLGSGPTAEEPVNLATGEEEYTPTDLTVYNPHGPSVSWGRIYNSLQAYDLTTGQAFGVPEQNDFGNGWSQTYNLSVQDAFGDTTNNKYVYDANGSRTAFVAPAIPNTSTPSVLCNVQPGAPFVVYWNYDAATTHTYFQVVNADRSQWVTSGQSAGTGKFFLLAKQIDRNGNYLDFNYTTTDTGFPLLSTITNQDGTTLLSILRVSDGTGNIAQIADCYGRSVFYHVEKTGQYGGTAANAYDLALDHVSQIVPTGATVLPDRYVYGYQIVYNYEPSSPERFAINYLHTITVPSPTGTGASTATINYDTSFNGPLVTSLVDGNGNTTRFISVDSSGNPANVTNYTKVTFTANGDTTPTYTYIGSYDNSMNGTTMTDGQGRVTSTSTFSDPNNPLRPSSVTDGNGNTTQYVWDTFGNLHQMTSPRGTVTNYTYAFPAATLSLVSGVVNTQQTAKSDGFVLGELLKVQEGTKSPTTFAYLEPSGLMQTITSPLPGTVGSTSTATTSYTYDGLGNLLTVTAPGNGTVSSKTTNYNYTVDGSYSQSAAIGQPLTMTNNLNEVTHLRYDAQGNAMAVIDALGNETDMTYTIANEMLATVLPATGQTGSGHASSQVAYLYAQPAANATAQWPRATLQYGPAVMTTQYDESSNPIRQIVKSYDYEGVPLSVKGSTEPVTYVYDALYRLSTLTDGGGNTTSYFYNVAGNLQQVVYPGAQTTPPDEPLPAGSRDTVTFGSPDNTATPGYDIDGNLLSRIDGRNQATTYTYADPESLLTKITYPASTIGNVALAYDAYGRRKTMGDGTGGQTYAYDDDDNLTQKNVTWTGVSGSQPVSYTFNPDGSRQSMTAGGRPWTYTYDGVGRLKTVVDYPSETTSYTYQANGWLQTKTLSNGIVATNTRDAQGRITDLVYKKGATSLANFHVPATSGYDGVGNRLSVTSTLNGGSPANYSGTSSYAYDYGQSINPQLNRSQVTGETSTRNGNYTNNFAYDGGISTGPGNPTSFKGGTRTFNSDNQLTNPGLAYDGAGNPTTYRSATLTFDPENRMTSDSTGSQTAAYNGNGLRAWKQTGSTKTYFLYDGDQPVLEQTSTGTFLAANTFGSDGLISRRGGPGTRCYLYDERGNVSQRTDSTGAVTGSDLYDAYGSRTGTVVQTDPFGFEAQAGYYTDTETELVLCTHRFYDPGVGRWLTRDPIGYDGGINLYGYVENNSVNDADPFGLFTFGVGVGGSGWAGPVGAGADVGVVLDSTGSYGVSGDVWAKNPGAPGWGGGVGGSPYISFSPGNLPPYNPCTGSFNGSGAFGGITAGPITITIPAGGGAPTISISLPSKNWGVGVIGGTGGETGNNIPYPISGPGGPVPGCKPHPNYCPWLP